VKIRNGSDVRSRRTFLQLCGAAVPLALIAPALGNARAQSLATRPAMGDEAAAAPAAPQFQQGFQLGPSGGRGGGPFSDPWTDYAISRVVVRHGVLVDSLQIQADPTALGVHGGNGGRSAVFQLDRDEWLTEVSGVCGPHDGDGFYVTAVYFGTSNGRYSDAYGRGGGDWGFTYRVPDGYEIAGFWGRSGIWVDALGVMVRSRF